LIRLLEYLILISCFVIPSFAQAGLDGYLRKGTYALNPTNNSDLFLYVPGRTLLYSIKPEEVKIGSVAFPDLQRVYVYATTQDGIDVLVWKREVKEDVESLKRYDFLVNRRLPLCLTEDSCESIWSKFNRISDEGNGWLAIWGRAGGKFFDNIGGIQKVSIDAGGWEDGFIPIKRDGFTIEDYGYITNLKRSYPLYRFTQKELLGLSTKCGEIIKQDKRKEIYTKLETYGKLSANIKMDPSAAFTKIIPEKYVKLLLKYLGLEAGMSAEGFLDGDWKSENTELEAVTNVYGQADECWQVSDVFIERRGISELGTDSDYRPYGRILTKKVYGCQGSEAAELKYTSFTLTFYDDNGTIIGDSCIHIPIDPAIVKKDIGIESEPLKRALVSVENQGEHFKLVDYFLKKGIPKSVSNRLISSINLSRSVR